MAQPSLFQFLTRTQISDIPLRPGVRFSRNTRSNAYPPENMRVGRWNLTYRDHDIMQSRYAGILFNKDFTNYLHPSPPQAVGNESNVQERLYNHVFRRVRRALQDTIFPPNHAEITVDTSGSADLPDSNGSPDIVGYTGHDPHRVLRLPGDVKCSWKWQSQWIDSPNETLYQEFHAVAAQINYYMVYAHSKYGYIITDTELVLFRRQDAAFQSYVEMAPGIPLSRYDSLNGGPYTAIRGRITALLGLWYIHMLAADNARWKLHTIFSDPEDSEDDDESGTFMG